MNKKNPSAIGARASRRRSAISDAKRVTGNISIDDHDLISAGDVCRLMGNRVSWQTVNRWMIKGVKSGTIKLDSVRIGRRLFTTRRAFERFMKQTSSGGGVASPPIRVPSDHEQAMSELREAGI